MGSINLYKIDPNQANGLTKELNKKMKLTATAVRTTTLPDKVTENFQLELYLAKPTKKKDISWDWVLEEFEQSPLQVTPAPKAVILVKRADTSLYAVTFGHSFFTVDKYCDRNFGFDFARRLDYKEIKTTTLTTPSSQRNKTVNTYVNYSELDFDSGESFAKLKAKVNLPESFSMYKPAIEMGNSIKFATTEESLDLIVDLIVHVVSTIETKPETCKIPVFTRVKGDELLERLNQNLQTKVGSDPAQVNISELDIIGATEIFNNNDGEFELRYKRKCKYINSLTEHELKAFCDEFGFDYAESVLDITVVSYYDGQSVATNSVKDIIDYTDDDEHCLLSKGIWYKYNEDYLSYLEDSIAEIPTIYDPAYDFTSDIHSQFVASMFAKEKEKIEYQGMTDIEIKKKLSTKYYAERAFNLIRAQEDSFINYDRVTSRIGGAQIEVMDLYKDETMYVVKIGNASGKLCTAVTQSLTALRLYKKGLLHDIPKITTAVLWFVLERKEHIEDENGKPDLSKLDLLMLKNKLDQWKKEVRLMGITPVVRVNYRSK